MSAVYIISVCITILSSFALPLIAAIFIIAKKHVKVNVILVGAAVFIIFQPLLRLLPMSIIQSSFPHIVPAAGLNLQFMVYALILALTAGIYEETGRYLAYKFVLKNNRNWLDGVGYGIGHGGIEAILLAGIQGIASLFIYATPPGQPDWILSVGGVERLFAMLIQVGLSLLVLYGINKKRISYFILAILLHTLVDFIAVMLQTTLGIVASESVIMLLAIASLVWIIKATKLFKTSSGGIDSLSTFG